MKFTRKLLVSIVLVLIFSAGGAAVFGQVLNPVDTLELHPKTKIFAETGLFIPYEGDLEIAPMAGVGFTYSRGGESFYSDIMFSRTAAEVSLPNDVDHVMFQLGYKTDLNKWKRAKIGAGLMVHQMDFGSNVKLTRTAAVFVGEYALSSDWLFQYRSTTSPKSGSTRLGGYTIGFIYMF